MKTKSKINLDEEEIVLGIILIYWSGYALGQANLWSASLVVTFLIVIIYNLRHRIWGKKKATVDEVFS